MSTEKQLEKEVYEWLEKKYPGTSSGNIYLSRRCSNPYLDGPEGQELCTYRWVKNRMWEILGTKCKDCGKQIKGRKILPNTHHLDMNFKEFSILSEFEGHTKKEVIREINKCILLCGSRDCSGSLSFIEYNHDWVHSCHAKKHGQYIDPSKPPAQVQDSYI